MRPRVLRAAPFALLLSLSSVASAAEERAGPEPPAWSRDSGAQFDLSPVVVLQDPAPGGLDLGLAYGLALGPVVVAPGGAIHGYFISGGFAGAALFTTRVSVPLGRVTPFAIGGVGPGGQDTADSGVAVLGGGGLTVALGRHVSLGLEVSYRMIASTDLNGVAIGPVAHFAQ